jgi:RNA polymerase sigma-70 factor (family 1)
MARVSHLQNCTYLSLVPGELKVQSFENLDLFSLIHYKYFRMQHPLPNERELVCRLRRGDRDAFDILFNMYSGKLYHFTYKYLQCREETEEVVQEVFLKVWEKRSTLDEELSFNALLFTISKRVALNVIRKKRNRDRAVSQSFVNSEPSGNYIEQEIFASQLLEYTKAAVDSLSPQRKRIFMMSREQYLSYDQIAASLNISRNTVEVQMVLALKEVRRYLRQYGINGLSDR